MHQLDIRHYAKRRVYGGLVGFEGSYVVSLPLTATTIGARAPTFEGSYVVSRVGKWETGFPNELLLQLLSRTVATVPNA